VDRFGCGNVEDGGEARVLSVVSQKFMESTFVSGETVCFRLAHKTCIFDSWDFFFLPPSASTNQSRTRSPITDVL
jgi:hypothetical protein